MRQAEHDLDLNVMNPCQPGAIEQIIDAQPSVVIMDSADGELAELVQLMTSELRVTASVSDLIKLNCKR